jgi:hypothetical protein
LNEVVIRKGRTPAIHSVIIHDAQGEFSMRHWFWIIPATLLVGNLNACSSNEQSGNDSNSRPAGSGGADASTDSGQVDTSVDDADASANPVDGQAESMGGSGGGSTTEDASDAGGPFKTGSVGLSQTAMTVNGTEYVSYSFFAQFMRVTNDPENSPCEIQEQGDCRIVDCATSTIDGGTMAYEKVSAGPVSLAGANIPLTLTPDATGTYEVRTGQERLWTKGASLTISAQGGEVPAFQTTLTGVGSAVVSVPAAASGSTMTISTKEPLALAWSGAEGGTMTATLSRNDANKARSVTISCSFDGAKTTGTVPASVMAMIPPGPLGSLVLMGGDNRRVDVSDWTIYVSETVVAVTTQGTSAAWSVTFE